MNSILLPLFPLNIVVFESEELRLHIFEPKYKKLIIECLESKGFFGIPLLSNGAFEGTGTQMEILRKDKVYENGEMDIVCKAHQRFKIKEVFAAKDTLNCAIGSIVYLPFVQNEDKELNLRITDLLNGLIRQNDIDIPLLNAAEFGFYAWVHKCGLSLEKELEMVNLQSTYERQLYIVEHLKNLFHAAEEAKQMKKIIQLNGHFKKLDQSF